MFRGPSSRTLSLPVSIPNDPVRAMFGVWLITNWLGLNHFSNSDSVAHSQMTTLRRKQVRIGSEAVASPMDYTSILISYLTPVCFSSNSINDLILSSCP